MPYIQCKDGKTYSRYDSSPYVKQCICEQRAERQEAYRACTEDPTCLAEREANKDFAGNLVVGFFITIAIIIVAAFLTIKKL